MSTNEAKLIKWANNVAGLSYYWGITDCGTLVRKGLSIFLNRDPFPNIPYWNDEQEARKIWNNLGGVDKAFLNLGAIKIEPNYRRTGDVALITILNDDTATLIINNTFLFSNEKGVKFRKLSIFDKLNIRFYRFK